MRRRNLPLLEGFHIKRMWKVRVGRLKRRDIATINTALSLGRLFHLIESGFAQHFIKISEIESGAMLPVAEHEVGKASADGNKMMWKGIVEPVGAILVVSNKPQAAAGLQYAKTFPKESVQFIGEEMLNHVG